MAIVVGVRFRTAGKIYDFSPENEVFEKGEYVIVETARGVECGEVLNGNHEVADSAVVAPLKPIQRRATPEDVTRNEENRRREKEAHDICQERIRRHKLEMKLIDVEYTFDNSKILFYFTADGRIDFRDLVKDLASVFRTRIELRQIGVRDEAKMLGAIATCGRELCCSTFLSEFHPVSIKMAKEQSLSLNPTKISGTCGRLMCCLKYETEAYEYLLKRSPRVDAIVKTPQGQGTVVVVSLLKELVKVRLDTETGNDLVEVRVEDIEIIKDGGKRHSNADKGGRGREDAANREGGPTREGADAPGKGGQTRDGGRGAGKTGGRDRNREGSGAGTREPGREGAGDGGRDASREGSRDGNRDRQRDGGRDRDRRSRNGMESGENANVPASAVSDGGTTSFVQPDWNDAVIEEPFDLEAETDLDTVADMAGSAGENFAIQADTDGLDEMPAESDFDDETDHPAG